MRVFLTLLLLCLSPALAAAEGLSVNKIRFGTHPDKIRAVIDLNTMSDFRVFALGDPYRLVIDLPSFNWKASPVTQPESVGVSHVRHGTLKKGISRIVLEMKNPITVKSAFMLPRSGTKSDRLVIDFSKTDTATFKDTKGEILGNLEVDTPRTYTRIDNNTERTETKPKKKPKSRKKPLIIIDPGHGGKDPGAVGAGNRYEKHIVLALSKELKKQLEDSGKYRVMMTRTKDVYIRLHNRVKFARKHEADLFVSVHADSVSRKNVRGASVYTLSEKASDAQSAKLAARENRSDIIAGVDLEVEDQDVANILVDLAMRDTMNQSKFFANKIVKSMSKNGVRVLDHTHRSAGFAVLKAPDIPSILVEAGFMSNRKEASMLARSDYRRKIAGALVDGIDTYFEYVEENSRD